MWIAGEQHGTIMCLMDRYEHLLRCHDLFRGAFLIIWKERWAWSDFGIQTLNRRTAVTHDDGVNSVEERRVSDV